MDLDKLDVPDYVIGGSAFVFFVSMFLPWWGIDVFGNCCSNSGWSYFLGGWIPLGLAGLMVLLILVQLLEVDLPEIPVAWGLVHLALAAGAAGIVFLRLLIPSSEGPIDLDRKYGLFVALLAAIGLVAGGFLKFQSEQSEGTGTGGGTPTQF